MTPLSAPRKIGPFSCYPVGLGCMNLSHAYGPRPSEQEGIALLNEALDLGYNMLDTAALYGFGVNESLLAKAVGHRRNEFTLASKGGMFKGPDGNRIIDGSPQAIRQHCEDSLKRLNTEVIDLYYLHRWDKNIPIEESIHEMSKLVDEGKIRELGLSEVSAMTLAKAHAVHPIAAVQTEYSLWTRNAEIAMLDKCRELGTAFVAFSPVGRGMLTGKISSINFPDKDIRHQMPRFTEPHFADNLALVRELETVVASEIDISPGSELSLASVVLAWVLMKADHIHVIPGTTSLAHLKENWLAMQVPLSSELFQKMDRLINQQTVCGTRYNEATQVEIDTEEFV